MSSHAFSDEELDALEAKCDAATSGPWERNEWDVWSLGDEGVTVAEAASSDDAEFIAAASPDTVKALVATVRELRGLLDRLVTIHPNAPAAAAYRAHARQVLGLQVGQGDA